MTSHNSPLSQDVIANLIKRDTENKVARPRGGRMPKDPTEPRVFATWWKLETHLERCDNPDCLDPRVEDKAIGRTMVANVKAKLMCRYCFLSGWGRDVA